MALRPATSFVIGLLAVAAIYPAQVQQVRDAQQDPPTATLTPNKILSPKIPPANRRKYRRIQEATKWRNPLLIGNRDSVQVRLNGAAVDGPSPCRI